MSTDRDTPEQWLEQHGTVLYRYALLQLRDPHRAEDAVQETFLAALQAKTQFSGGSSRRTWLVGILKHKIIDQFRRDSRETSLDDPDGARPNDMLEQTVESSFLPDGHWAAKLGDWDHPEMALESSQFWNILQLCLDLLPKRLAQLFMLRELFEEESESICKDMSITPNNLWTMLYRARIGLRKCLDSRWTASARGGA